MKKLRLDVEKIRVDRFETVPDRTENGTVILQEATGDLPTWCLYDTCWIQSCVTGPPYPCRECP